MKKKKIRFYMKDGSFIDSIGKGFNSCSHKIFGVRLKKAQNVFHAIACIN